MVFAVNPEPMADKYVYPLAMDFKDFLRVILACGSTTAPEQVIGWSKEQFDNFVVSEDNAKHPEQEDVLEEIKSVLKLEPMENVYEYVKAVQEQFDDSKIKFSNEYYDTLGLERPDGSENEGQMLEFGAVTFSFVKREK